MPGISVLALVLAQLAAAAAFPSHKPRERVGYDTVYAGSCTGMVGNTRTALLSFSVRVGRRSINILKAGFGDTSHFGIEMANPPGGSAAETGDSKSYGVTAFSSTAFGGKASSYLYTGSGQKFTCTNGADASCLMDFDFVNKEFTATTINRPWAELVTEKVRRHWPRLNGKPMGPPPAERLMATISLSNLSSGTSTTSGTAMTVSALKEALEKNYSSIVSGVTLKSDGTVSATSPTCTFTVAMDYDIGWTVWPLVVTAIVGVLVTVAVSVFKCCPCAAVKRLYRRTQRAAPAQPDALTAEPTSGPSEVDVSEEALRADQD